MIMHHDQFDLVNRPLACFGLGMGEGSSVSLMIDDTNGHWSSISYIGLAYANSSRLWRTSCSTNLLAVFLPADSTLARGCTGAARSRVPAARIGWGPASHTSRRRIEEAQRDRARYQLGATPPWEKKKDGPPIFTSPHTIPSVKGPVSLVSYDAVSATAHTSPYSM